MRAALTLIFIVFGVPLLTMLLISGYEFLSHCFRPTKQSGVSPVSSSVTIQARID